MHTEKLYQQIYNELKVFLNYNERNSLKKLSVDNMELLQQKLKKQKRTNLLTRIILIALIISISLIGLILYLGIFSQSVRKGLALFLIEIPLVINTTLLYKNGLAGGEKKVFLLKMMILLTNEDEQFEESKIQTENNFIMDKQ